MWSSRKRARHGRPFQAELSGCLETLPPLERRRLKPGLTKGKSVFRIELYKSKDIYGSTLEIKFRSEGMDKHGALKQYFGHDCFRTGQEDLIDAVLSGRDVLGIMPTGGGKSICYQIPALLLPGVTLVISPLISLMKDQVTSLNIAGIPAGYINSSLSSEQLRAVFAHAREGKYKLLYVAPERLGTQSLLSLMERIPISLIAVDEAHCVSQWGQDFRPSYLKIADFAASFPKRPVVAAYTATATEEVRQDIVRLLDLKDPLCTVTGFDRPNLFFDVRTPHDKMSELISLIKARKGKSGIIYCATRANVERIYDVLNKNGVSITRYHAGLEDEERRRNQEDFQYDRKNVMAATNAFGMGIDKSNVSYVIHYNMPKSMEAYYQEAGRAGRDGTAADCILLYSDGDIMTAKFLIENSGNDELNEEEQALIRRRDYKRLDAIVGYCKTTGCLRAYILEYFGQAHPNACGNCGNCKGEYQEIDITVPAQMILSCLRRVKKHLGYYVGKSLVIQILRGGKTQRVSQLGLDTLSTYGLMKEYSAAQTGDMIGCLNRMGYIRTTPHAAIEPTEKASAVLFGGEKVSMSVRKDRVITAAARQRKKKHTAEELPAINDLFSALKSVRWRIAKEEGVPAYIVFSNAVLVDMSVIRPRTMEEFLGVPGVGEIKAARYGAAFLEAVAWYERENEV